MGPNKESCICEVALCVSCYTGLYFKKYFDCIYLPPSLSLYISFIIKKYTIFAKSDKTDFRATYFILIVRC